MSRTLILGIVIAALGAGAYYLLNQPEPTPAEQVQSATEDASEAVTEAASAAQEAASDALDSATEQASEAASAVTEQVSEAASSVTDQATEAAEQAGQAATDLADQAGEQVASLANQGQELVSSWIEDGSLSLQNFDYDKMVASVQESTLAQDLKTQAIKILDDIKASPETIALKIQELQQLFAQQ